MYIYIYKLESLFNKVAGLQDCCNKHLHCLSKGLDTYVSQYDNIILLGDPDVERVQIQY